MSGGDFRGWQVKVCGCAHVGTTFPDLVTITNLLITPPIPLEIRSNTWNLSGGTKELTAQSDDHQ